MVNYLVCNTVAALPITYHYDLNELFRSSGRDAEEQRLLGREPTDGPLKQQTEALSDEPGPRKEPAQEASLALRVCVVDVAVALANVDGCGGAVGPD